MQQQTIVKCPDAAAFLRLVPHLAGVPTGDSLVLVAFRGKRTAGAMRLDLPPTGLPDKHLKRFATSAVGMICRVERIDGVVPVVYTDELFAEAGDLPRADFLQRLTERAERAGLEVRDALVVAGDGYGSLFDPMLPPWGLPLDDLDRPVQQDLPEEALRPVLDVEAAVAPLEVDPVDTAEFRAALQRCTRMPLEELSRHRRDRLGLAHRWRYRPDEALIERYRPENRDGPEYDGSLVGRILAGLEDPTDRIERALDGRDGVEGIALLAAMADLPVLRDLITVQIGWGQALGRESFERTVRGGHDDLAEDDLITLIFLGGDVERPDSGRVERGIGLLRRAAAHTAEDERVPLLTMIAWLHWTLGRASVAGRFVVRAREVSPGYGLAEVVDAMVTRGMLPEWAFHAVPLGGPGLARMLPEPVTTSG